MSNIFRMDSASIGGCNVFHELKDIYNVDTKQFYKILFDKYKTIVGPDIGLSSRIDICELGLLILTQKR